MSQSDIHLHITGVGKSAGGKFENVSIDGSGAITGELICRKMSVNGHGKFSALTQALETEINGLATFESTLTGDAMTVNGMATMNGEVTIGETLNVNGRAKFNGVLHAGRICANGMLTSTADIEAERFEGSAALNIAKLLNANRIDLRLVTKCTIGEIGCATITVRRNTGWLLGFGGSGSLNCPLIEGDDLDLEGVTAATVRGDAVIIGEGCQIERVEYRKSYKVHPDAFVKEAVQVDA